MVRSHVLQSSYTDHETLLKLKTTFLISYKMVVWKIFFITDLTNNLIHNNLMSQKSETELKLVSLYCVSYLALSQPRLRFKSEQTLNPTPLISLQWFVHVRFCGGIKHTSIQQKLISLFIFRFISTCIDLFLSATDKLVSF